MDTIRIELLANEILASFKNTLLGHCARVDFLNRTEAVGICQFVAQKHMEDGIAVRILASHDAHLRDNYMFITTDKAIELRNRKEERLCLFVPSDIVDAAYSSLSNSFALIDGRKLHAAVLKRVMGQLSAETQHIVRAVFAQLRGGASVSDERRLDFAVAVLRREQANELAQIGLELWRVGLIADARDSTNATFVTALESNRSSVQTLARPKKLDATVRERIQSLKVDAATAIKLGNFFRGRSMNDVQAWSCELATQEALTFDYWVFPRTDPSDIRSVAIIPFVNARGEVERYCRLKQPDGTRGSLFAYCGSKEKLIVRWKCDPEQPKNLNSWRVGIVPSRGESESEGGFDLPERDVPSQRRNIEFKLDMDFEEPPDFALCVKVVPLNVDGSEIKNEENEPIFAESTEFFLVKDNTISPPDPPKESRTTVTSLAYGRLEEAVKVRESVLTETEPQWISKDLEYFSLRLNERRILNIGLSNTLLELEKRIIDEPRKGGCFILNTDEVRPVSVDAFSNYPLQSGNNEAWSSFWKARESFFLRLKKASPRDVIEVVDWIPELTNVALRYAQTYGELVDDLAMRQADLSDLRDVLSVDTLLVRIAVSRDTYEEATIILPTHPLRVAWFASYNHLLRIWEEQLLERQPRERKYTIDLQALHSLVPINVPAFAYHSASTTPYTFFQNLRFFHGVALPAGVPDPHRRYGDIARILNAGLDQGGIGDVQPDHLTEHLAMFRDLHPYADPLVTTLINPDRGDFFAEAVRKLVPARNSTGDEDESRFRMPMLQVTAYSEDGHKSMLQALEQVRQLQIDPYYSKSTDHFLPSMSTTSRPISQLEKESLPEAHIAVVTDFTRPAIVAAPLHADEVSSDTNSFSVYGLINRFVSQFTTDSQELLWKHRIITEAVRKPEPHPAGSRYSETLTELHTSLLKAGGYLLGGPTGTRPVLEVRLEAKRRELLERLHASTNWVITLDRFFTLDYYDSPNAPGLDDVARKYVLDYSPEFTEGLGHRMMVTTAWHEEIGSLLSQAMDELGFSSVEQSVSRLLHYLKTISGRLALQALESPTNAAAAVGLGVVTAWLQNRGRLRQAVLIPVDVYPRLFSQEGSGRPNPGERRCDLVLISLKRNIVDATFIEVKWRRGQVPLEELSKDMVLQMQGSEQVMRSRFFDDDKRVDGALQRSYLANVLRFYFERSRRYKLFDEDAEASFVEHITKLEKTGLAFRPSYEGYIVSLEGEPRKPLQVDDAKITILTAEDFENTTSFLPLSTETIDNDGEKVSIDQDTQQDMTKGIEDDESTDAKGSNESTLLEDTNVAPQKEEYHDDPGEVVIPLGEAPGGLVDWKPSVKGSPHLFILGIPGQGKSWTVIRMLSELGRQHVPSLVLDFHGQFAEPHGAFVQAIRPTVLDAAKGLPFSPFECTRNGIAGDWKANTYAIAEIFAYVAGLGDMQRDIVYTAVRDAYKAHGFSDDLVDNDAADLEYPTLTEVLKRIEQNEQVRHASNVAARCRPLLEMDLFQPTEHAPDLLSLVRNGLVIDLHNLYAETLHLAAGAFVLRKLYKDMFQWGYADRLRLAIVLDEAHRLAKDVTLPKIMKEGRKFGIAVIVASQGVGDFHPDVLSNVGTKVIFRMNYPESKKVSGFIRARQGQDLVTRIEQLPVGSAYVQTPEMMFGSVVQMYPLL